ASTRRCPARARGRAEPSRSLAGEEAILWPRQPQVLAQRLPAVLAPEDAPALELGHELLDEVVDPAGDVRKEHVEAVAAFPLEPGLHLVGDARGGADEREAAEAADPARELPNAEVLTAREL